MSNILHEIMLVSKENLSDFLIEIKNFNKEKLCFSKFKNIKFLN
jgi:hypothetical protein